MDLKQASILLVEDEPFLREIMAEWLQRSAGKVCTAGDGAEALNVLAANQIDLLISDVRMPKMDGIGLLKELQDTVGCRTRVLFITGFSDIPLRDAYAMGAEAVLEKPIKREELLELAKRSLAAADELWREPPLTGPSTQLKISFDSLASALVEKRIAFGRRGFCVQLTDAVREGPLEFALDFKADQRVLSGHGVVRWTAPQERQAGIEITHIDDASRAWLIELIERNKPVAFVPRSTGMEQAPGVKIA